MTLDGPGSLPTLDDDAREIQRALPETYMLERELGRGGMAMVYVAWDRKHDRRVALKILREELATESGAERFLTEIGFTARLSHPHILPLLDSGRAHDRPFYVMPLVAGESLRARLDRTRTVPLAEALHIAHDVADALAYAHAQGVVHRDIKPENIMLSGRHALVADLGIARAMHAISEDGRLTQVGLVVGTPAYMSPEQAAGDETVDGRSDVCSLGVVLYEMLVGECPFAGPNARAIILQQMTRPVPSARVTRPELPEVIDRMLATAMAREPADRFASAAEFADTLASLERSLAQQAATGSPVTTHVPHVPSLAVLPFDNLTTDPENEFLSDGIAEDVLTMLARRRALRVCARSSSFAFRGRGLDLRHVAERLGVRHVLTGSVRRAGARLRVTVQLVNASDGTQMWSERYEREVDDVFAIQDEIATSIVEALNETLLAREVAAISPPTQRVRHVNVAAYEACLRGRHLWGRRTAENTQRALDWYRQAIVVDPEYVVAWSGLADVLALQGVYGDASPTDVMPKAREAARRALSIDPDCAEAHATLGLVSAAFDWRWNDAQASFQRAIALNPSYPVALQWYATNYLTPLGRVEEALDATRAALRLDPLSLALKASLAVTLLYGRRYQEAASAARDALDLDGGFAVAYYFLGQALLQLGEHDGGLAASEAAVRLSGRSGETLAALGAAKARVGDEAAARAILAELETMGRSRYVSPGHFALIHAALGDWDRTLQSLEAAVQGRAIDTTWLGVRPAWDPLRGDPRFRALERTLGIAT